MADTKGIRAGRAYVELGVNDKISKGLEAARKKLKAFGEGLQSIGKRMMGWGGAAFGAMMAAAKSYAEGGHELLAMSKRTGLSVEALSELGFAATQSGVDIETLEKGIRLMEKTIGEAAQGTGSAVTALAHLGLTLQDLKGLTPDKQLELLADRISRIQDPSKRAAIAMETFGRSGTQMLPLLMRGAKGIEELRRQAEEFGLVATTEGAEKAAKLRDALNLLWLVSKKLYKTIGDALAPTLTGLANTTTGVVVSAMKWLKTHKELIVTAFRWAVAVFAVGAALYFLGTVIVKAIAVATFLKTVVLGLGGFLQALAQIVLGLFTPFGLLIGVAVGVGVAFAVMSGLVGKAMDWLQEQFRGLLGTVNEVLGGISDALVAGDIQLAAKVLWLGLQLAWQEGIAALDRVWLESKKFFVTVAYDMWYGAMAAAEEGVFSLQKAWLTGSAVLKTIWRGLAWDFKSAWLDAVDWTEKKLIAFFGMFDKRIDVKQAQDWADQENKQAQAQFKAEAEAQVKGYAKQYDFQMEQAKKVHEATMAQIGGDYDKQVAGLNTEHDNQIAATKSALEVAKGELAKAIAQARQERQNKDAAGGPAGYLSDAMAQIQDWLDNLDSVAAKINTTGTFNASAAWGLGSGSVAERTAKAAEQTAKNTGRLADAARGGGLVFA